MISLNNGQYKPLNQILVNYSELRKYCGLHNRVLNPKDRGSMVLVNDAPDLSGGCSEPTIKGLYQILRLK